MEQFEYEINNYDEKSKKRYDLIRDLQLGNVELSYSWLKEMSKSPSHFINYKLKDYTPPTESMVFGSMVDCLLTEPENFEKNFTILDKVPTSENQIKFCNAIIDGALISEAFNLAYKRGNSDDIYKEFETYIKAIINNETTTTKEKYNEAKEIAETLKKDSSVQLFLDNAVSFQQKSVIEYEGWKIKRFTDIKGNGLTADLKLMSQLSPDYADKEIFKMDYDLQGAIYTLDNTDRFFNICYDRKGNSLITEYDQSVLMYGKDKLDYCLRKLYECCENPILFNESYNFHDLKDDTLGIKVKKIYKPAYLKSYRN